MSQSFATLPQAAISIPPTNSPPTSPKSPSPKSPSPKPHRIPSATSAPSACPFAVLAPALTPSSDTPPRCPRWVRVLRFSAKVVVKQVVMRTLKHTVRGIFSSLRNPSARLPLSSSS